MTNSLTQNKKKKNIAQVQGPFNFKKYPKLFFDYLQYLKLNRNFYKFSVMDGDGLDVGDKLDNAEKKLKSGEKIFAEAIYNIFNPIKPTLYNSDKDFIESNWDAVFDNKSFDELDKYQIRFLVGLIICDYVYVLDKKYYIKDNKYFRDRDRSFQTTQYIDIDKMKKLLQKENKKIKS